MSKLNFIKTDGGRSKYFKGTAGDCVTRAIAIATNTDYKEVYNTLKKLNGKTVRNGVSNKIAKSYMENTLGWKWVPTMGIGTGCKVRLNADELPQKGTIVVRLSGHWSVVKDGNLLDTQDCSREGTRCVYGYFVKGAIK